MSNIKPFKDYGETKVYDKEFLLPQGKAGRIKIYRPRFRQHRTFFLEHGSSGTFSRQVASDRVIVVDSDTIFISRDNGRTWFERPAPCVYVNAFTLLDGSIIFYSEKSSRLDLYDDELNLVSSSNVGNYSWHGSWGCDQNELGTIIWGEYAPSANEMNVYRSVDGGQSWDLAFSKPGPKSEQPFIRHWHLCRADPFIKGRWYLSSGDSWQQCKLYISDDDGLNWRLWTPDFKAVKPFGFDSGKTNSLIRSVALWIEEPGKLKWITDDTLDGRGSALISADIESGRLTIDGYLGENEMRGYVQHGDLRIAISESKIEPAYASIFAISENGVNRIANIEKHGEGMSSFVASMLSVRTNHGVFFSQNNIDFFPPNCRTLRWKIIV